MSNRPQQNLRDKLFSGKVLDIEQIILNSINEIMLSPLKIAELGDATKANSVMEGLVMNLDAFFSRILLSEEGRDTSAYQKKRDDLVEKWRTSTAKNMAPPVEVVRDLFKLTVEAMSKERLFKVRRYVYFGYHWKQGQKIDLERLETEDAIELEGEGPDDES